MDLTKYFETAPTDLGLSGRSKGDQLLRLYAFNAYFNADVLSTDDVDDGCTYLRDENGGLDGVFVNETLEENTIECIHSYYVGDGVFDLPKVVKNINSIALEIEDVNNRIFTRNTKADNLLGGYLTDSDNRKVIIRIITDYSCPAKEKYELNKKIEGINIPIKGLDVSVVISFGDDVKTVIESNRAPFDWVEEGRLYVDEPNNYLRFEDHSIVCNISAQSLKKLWEAEGNRGLLAMNLRYYIKSSNIDGKLEDSIINDGQDFWYLNNGIIIVCNDYQLINNELRLKQFSIVNGGQTSRMIGTIPFDDDFYICCKVIKNVFETPNDKNVFIAKVAEASNTQKPIKPKDIIANRIEQRNLKSLMQDNNVFIEIKRGEKCNTTVYKEPWQRTKNNELAQDLYSFVYMEPGPARNSVSSILQNQDKYNTIFKNHEYPFDFLRDIVFLEKAYKEYQKKINKMTDVEADKKGLVKNGLWYCLATIGYILKFRYNHQFAEDIQDYRNQPAKYNLCSSELAFAHGFIDRQLTYKEFRDKAYALFDIVFSQILIEQFRLARENNPSIVYSNWTKSNTGFNTIRNDLNFRFFDLKNRTLISAISNFFVEIDTITEEQNVEKYKEYCQKNEKKTVKDNNGIELSPNDVALRDDLKVFRFNYSQQHHISEKKVLSDTAIAKIITQKPVSSAEIKKIISATSFRYVGNDLLEIIAKYL